MSRGCRRRAAAFRSSSHRGTATANDDPSDLSWQPRFTLRRSFTSTNFHPNTHTPPVAEPTMASSVDQKLLRSTKFPPEFNQKVDIRKINVEVMKK